MLKINREDRAEVTILTLSGHLDALNAPVLKEQAEALVTEGRFQIVFDMADLNLIDSSGVGAVVSLYKQVRQRHGDAKIAALMDQPKEIFKLLRLDRAFDLAPTVDAAIERFAS